MKAQIAWYLPYCLVLSFGSTAAADQPYKTFTKSIEKQYFPLRAHESLCRRHTAWDSRSIRECRLTKVGESVAINGVADWEGRYFVSGRKYRLKSTRLEGHGETLEIKLWAEPVGRGALQDEIRIEIPEVSGMDAAGIEHIFFGVFLRPSEDLNAYETAVNRKLVEQYLNPEPELFALPLEKREKILSVVHLMGFPAQPKLERIGQDLYIPADLVADFSIYNDLQVSENRRLATTIEKEMKDIRMFGEQAGQLPVIKGINFRWKVYHKNLTDERAAPTEEDIHFLVPLQAISEFAAGNLSAFELTQRSLLRADGVKVTLTSFDPIGSQ
jgi:hypothetical protein